MSGLMYHRASGLLVLVGLVARSALALEPYVSVTQPDGTTYSLYRNADKPITAAQASATCAAAGGQLASLTSPEQVRSSLWSQQVVNEVANDDTALLWTGLRISWSNSNNRRMLRADGSVASSTTSPDDDDGQRLLERLVRDMESSGEQPPATTPGGRTLPLLVRAWMYDQQRRNQRRALLGSGEGNEAPYLNNAKLSWADGSAASFVLKNPANLGFLACNRKKMAECCGAVFDIGPDPYPGSDFPTIFFYPCGSEKIVGATIPTGFACEMESFPVAELPKPKPATKPSPSRSTCSAGYMPAAKHMGPPCVRCKVNMFSADGVKCKPCPAGKTAGKGAVTCK